MDNPVVIVLLTILGVFAARMLLGLILTGGDVGRMWLAVRTGWRVLTSAEFAGRVEPLLGPPAVKAATPPKPSGEPLRLLTLLQREGRLIDFLMEDIQGYPNDQVGAAVRDIHRDAQRALKEHLVLEPIFTELEDSQVEVAPGFNPSAVQLTGNVTGQPPFRGTLRHHGWRVREIKLNPPPPGQDEFVLQPAEVELQ